jgi:hypothetical protein
VTEAAAATDVAAFGQERARARAEKEKEKKKKKKKPLLPLLLFHLPSAERAGRGTARKGGAAPSSSLL